jgi:hypothetical protein
VSAKVAECHQCNQAVKLRKTGYMVEHTKRDGSFCPGSAMLPRKPR